jgi:uncharacterized membrane protein
MREIDFFLFITNVCVVIFCGALLLILPLLTRKSFLFGVKVPPEAQATDEARTLKRSYLTITLIGSLIVLAASVWQYLAAPDYTIFAVIFFPFVLVAVQFLAFVPNHGRALELKARLGWKVEEVSFADTQTSFTRGNLSAMPHFWYVVSLIIVISSFVVILVRYPSLPDAIPTHWNFDMEPDAWSPKTVGSALSTPIMSLGMAAVMWLVGVLIERAKLQIDYKEPAKSFAQHKKYRRLMGHGIGVLTLAVVVLFFIVGLQTAFVGFTVPFWCALAIVIAPSILVCVIVIRAGQGGALLKVDVTEISAAANGDVAGAGAMSDDKYWAWGLFYHNPDDPAYFVGNRFGGNIGFNYSRLPVKIGVAIGLAALVATYVWMVVVFRTLI